MVSQVIKPEDQKSKVQEILKLTVNLNDNEKKDLFKKEFYDPCTLKVRDFGFPMEDIKHWGQTEETPATEIGAAPSSDSMERESKFTGRVRALYDFNAENPTELTFKKGDELYVHYRQTEGWLVGFYKDEKLGLIPENYVEFLDE